MNIEELEDQVKDVKKLLSDFAAGILADSNIAESDKTLIRSLHQEQMLKWDNILLMTKAIKEKTV